VGEIERQSRAPVHHWHELKLDLVDKKKGERGTDTRQGVRPAEEADVSCLVSIARKKGGGTRVQ